MSEALIQMECVTKVYGRGAAQTAALRDISLAIARNEWLAIMGPSGHGKSTLLQLMGGLDRPTTGAIRLDGAELSALSPGRLAAIRARRIGFVFQFFNLLPHLTALENVQTALWFGGTSRQNGRALELLGQVGLADKARSLPGELSGGQQQRVAIARALANEPDVLLLDEPTGNLDSAAEAELLALLDVLHGSGRTIVMVTHNPVVASRAKRLVSVRDGRIERDG
ncbi:MAG: ABC transporter ATP-binding protein [Gammaproteobacteria bacterium]|nr:ABC transporter ATP-binding protein [Gammaproteobacteria bacterium]